MMKRFAKPNGWSTQATARCAAVHLRLAVHLLLAVVSVATLLVTESIAGESIDRRFVDGLRARRLFTLAATECGRQLDRETLSDEERVEWVVELIQTYAQHAANSLPSSRDARWKSAHDAAAEFLAAHRNSPRRILVEVQDALTSLAEGELARMEAEVAAQPQAARDRARTTIRAAARALEELDRILSEQIVQADRTTNADALTADELFSLQNHVRFQLARAFRNRALCYPDESDDQIAALSMAIEQLKRTLSQLQANDPLVLQVYLDLAICHRLLGNLEQAYRSLSAPLADQVPRSMRLRAGAEQVRILLAAGRSKEALEELERLRTAGEEGSAELDFAQLETYLALWNQATKAKEESQALEWQKNATAAVKFLESSYGPYWGRRGELALLHVAGDSAGTGNVEILGRAADNLYRKGQLDDAVVAYERAAQQASGLGDRNTAFKMEYRAALIEQMLKRLDLAYRRLRRISLAAPANSDAPTAHLLAAVIVADLARAEPEMIQQYAQLLEEHLAQWPSSSTADQAGQWLGRLRESEQNWAAAVDAYGRINADADFYPEAISAIERCWNRALEERRASGESIDENARAAIQFFDALVFGPDRVWPKVWTDAQRDAAVATARLRLNFLTDGHGAAEQMLQTALRDCPQAPAAWRDTVQSLLVVALAGQPTRLDDARRLLDQFSGGAPDRLLELIEGLSAIADAAPPDVRRALANLQLTALDRLGTGQSQLDGSQRVKIEEIRADSLEQVGQREQALEVRRSLARNNPDNRRIQIDFAQLLLESSDKSFLSQALDQWRRVAKRLRPGTDDWYRARYSIALAYYKRNQPGDRALAAERLRYLKATSNVDETAWKTKVDELLAKCQ